MKNDGEALKEYVRTEMANSGSRRRPEYRGTRRELPNEQELDRFVEEMRYDGCFSC